MIKNRLVIQHIDEQDNATYSLKQGEYTVKAETQGGLAPTLTYFLDDEDITEDIRALRFSLIPPQSFLDEFEDFQAMLYTKEQQALQTLYDQYTIRPKNMTATQQVIWSFGLLLIIAIPIFLILYFT